MTSVITSMKRKSSNFGDPKVTYDNSAFFGIASQSFIKAIPGIGVNNLEEQSILGFSTIISSWEEKDKQGNPVLASRVEYTTPQEQKNGYYYTEHHIFYPEDAKDFSKVYLSPDESTYELNIPSLTAQTDILVTNEGNTVIAENEDLQKARDPILYLRNGIEGSSQVFWFKDPETGETTLDEYGNPILFIKNLFLDKDKEKKIETLQLWYRPPYETDEPNKNLDIIICEKEKYKQYIEIKDNRYYVDRETIIPRGYITREEYDTQVKE